MAQAVSTVAVTVQPTVETQPHSGNADDPAIWIHPTDPSQSLVIGTHKNAGIGVYTLAGNELQFVSQDGGMNNVDLRYNFPLGGESVALATATNRQLPVHNTIAMYKVNPFARQLENVTTSPPIQVGIAEVYGTCMYHSPVTGKYYVFINGTSGDVEQWELFDNGSGKVTGALVRSFAVGSQTEGCLADDQLADFYIGEEAVGIWKYGAEPGDGTARVQVDSTGSGGHLIPQVEGLTLYYASNSTGYLIASSQGSDEFVFYRREGNNDYVVTFKIVAGNGIDEVTKTDGIDVSNFSLGPSFPQGVFVAHDTLNDGGARNNFKLVPWPAIANAVNPPLIIDTTWDPRQVVAGATVQFSSNAYVVAESGSIATITVTLSASSAVSVTVNYSTGSGTATPGSDYTSASGTLLFAPGQTSRTFSVPILSDLLVEANETVSLTLNSPTNAAPGSPSNATLSIIDSSPYRAFVPLILRNF